ncbi:MAG TPA: hypothetical protein VK136_04225 [Bacillota bacterium]|nr:hypothetical protein [Bacillota bacterium]
MIRLKHLDDMYVTIYADMLIEAIDLVRVGQIGHGMNRCDGISIHLTSTITLKTLRIRLLFLWELVHLTSVEGYIDE